MIELNMLGGTFLHRQAILLGKSTFNGLESWKFDAAFLGGEGMDSTGISNSHPEIAAFQRAVIDRSVDAYFCIDASKLGRTTPHRVGVWEELGALVTDATTAQLASAGITLPREQLILAK